MFYWIKIPNAHVNMCVFLKYVPFRNMVAGPNVRSASKVKGSEGFGIKINSR